MENEPIKIFIAYSRTDGDMLEELRKQFSPLEISKKVAIWYDGEIRPGEKWDERIQEELHSAEIILLLVSSDSISSKYFYESEVQKAIKRDEHGETKVIPVILRPCLWEETPLAKLQALPTNGNAIKTWTPIDSGYFNVVENIKRIADDLLWERQFEKHPETALKTIGILNFFDSDGNRVEYEGDIIKGKANGYGVSRSLGNLYYEYNGNYKNNLRHDENGIMKWGSGHKYQGSFQDDKRTGKGKFVWDNGYEYEGDFLDNTVMGLGLYKTTDYVYEGEMKGQSPHKRGKMVNFKENYTYEGEFWEGIKRGKGKIIFENGLTYEGDFLEDQPDGIGIRVLPNGVIYEGEFRKGKAFGKGRMFTEKFDIYEGVFIHDCVNKGDVFVDTEGNKLEYSYDSMSNKLCKVSFLNGDVFEGKKEDFGALNQVGLYTFFNGGRLQVTRHESDLLIEFENGTILQGFGGVKKAEKVFEGFYRLEAGNIYIHYQGSFYSWSDGKSMPVTQEKYKIDPTSGHLLDKVWQ